MSVKAGSLLSYGNGFLCSRVQTDGVSNLNIPKEQILEVGNFKTVANVRDIPDLSYDIESLDVTCDLEAMLTHVDPTTVTPGQEFVLDNSKPLDVTAPFKKATGVFTIYKGIIVPYLTLESSDYTFGVTAKATQKHTVRGDAIYFTPGMPIYREFAASGTGPYSLGADTAIQYTEGSDTFYILGLCWIATDGTFKRLFHGIDYTDSSGNFTLLAAPPVGSTIRAVWGTTNAYTIPQSVHPSTTVSPAAVKSKNIDLYLGTNAATPVYTRWQGVQTVQISRKVTLQNDEEFGNVHYVSQDYDTPAVTGTIGVKPADLDALFNKVADIAGVSNSVVAGPNSTVTLPMQVRISHPDTGAVLKTFEVPDAHLTPPPVQGKVNTKIEISIPFESDSGSLSIFRGVPAVNR